MAETAAEARAELQRALDLGFDIDFIPQPKQLPATTRRSAVLVLFGALDEIPAHRGPSTVPPELDVLLTRRSAWMRHHPGQIAFPGGGVEPGDAGLAATALREAAEETGLNPAGVEVLGELPALHIPVSDNLVTPVIGWWRLPSSVEADGSESVDVMRVPVGELLAPDMRGVSVVNYEDREFRGAAFKLSPRFGEHIVWGFTGMLLSSLFEGVGWAAPGSTMNGSGQEFHIPRSSA